MRTHLSVFIAVPIEEVFAFFDDPANSIAFQEHPSEHLRGSRLWGQGAAKLELEHSLHNIAEHLEAKHRAAAGT